MKRLHNVQFHLDSMLEKQNYRDRSAVARDWGQRGERETSRAQILGQ